MPTAVDAANHPVRCPAIANRSGPATRSLPGQDEVSRLQSAIRPKPLVNRLSIFTDSGDFRLHKYPHGYTLRYFRQPPSRHPSSQWSSSGAKPEGGIDHRAPYLRCEVRLLRTAPRGAAGLSEQSLPARDRSVLRVRH